MSLRALLLLLVAALGVFAMAGSVRPERESDMVTSLTVEKVQGWLKELGIESEIEDETAAVFEQDGWSYRMVVFFPEMEGADKTELMMQATKKGGSTDVAIQWNQISRFGRAYFGMDLEEDGAMFMEHDIDVSGGVTELNVLANINRFMGSVVSLGEMMESGE